MRITAKGQVSIPQDVRERARLMPGTNVEFEIDDGVVRLVKAKGDAGRETRGQKLVDGLRGAADFGMTTDQIIALLRGPCADEEHFAEAFEESRGKVDPELKLGF